MTNPQALKRRLFSKRFINKYIKSLKSNQKLKIVFGGHWSNNPNWLILTKLEQDITKRLKFSDETVDVIFTEHVIEHLTFLEAINFMIESKRILKKGGIFRVVCPMIDNLKNIDFRTPNSQKILNNRILPFFKEENNRLLELDLNGIFEDPELFLFHSFFKKHGHEFIWSANLMIKVLHKIGFESVKVCEIGKGLDPEACIERRRRGIYVGHNWKEELNSEEIFDMQSIVIEAIK
ncbi:MAG: methyltransferase domain-containing protein [Promethearchaeota archaeon]